MKKYDRKHDLINKKIFDDASRKKIVRHEKTVYSTMIKLRNIQME